ncbi:permease of the major facilitator superfamily [Anaerolinea thermolimosa]|uniref:MFS transporter n=1 Tax=Anaerolinea thermolimosa TaxID=229919 RepID=UPI000A065442|nr:MFS transporter [Anaerolinea thermolimosa]GAP06448.1 permease of the major facilitator superfamily [Anaerolinea thermolimosa]
MNSQVTETAHQSGQELGNNHNEKLLERNVVSLGWVAFFGGLAQDMIQPVLPIFYTSVLGLSKEFIGLIEGSLTTIVSLMKIGAGYLSDALGVRKAIVFVGYAFSAVARFGLGLATSGAAAFGLRLTDGVGKGLKDAPRDALVAGSAGHRKLGLAFGIQRTLDTLGSVAGPLITYGLLRLWVNHPNRYREVFLTAGALAFIPLIIIGLWVKERKQPVSKQILSLSALKGPFAGFLGIMLLFTLGNSSDAFLILRAEDVGVSATSIPLVVALFNLVSALTAIPAGRLSDRIGRRRAITIGWGIYAAAYLGFAVASQAWMVWLFYAFYGLYYAFTEGSAKAMVAELVPEASRGSAYGLFNASVGVMALPASVIAGYLWNWSPAAPFAFGALMAFLAFVALWFLPKPKVV